MVGCWGSGFRVQRLVVGGLLGIRVQDLGSRVLFLRFGMPWVIVTKV